MNMKRRVMRIMLFLLLGAIINVAVAWGCVAFNPTRDFGDLRWQHLAADDSALSQGWPVNVPDKWGHPDVPGYQVSHGAVEVLCVYADQGRYELLLFTVGFPSRSLAWHTLLQQPSTGRGTKVFQATNDPWNDGLGSMISSFPTWKRWPLRPLWPGFAINTLFYAAILWCLFAAPFALRRRRRIKRGLCSKCAYDLRGTSSETCPECGEVRADR